MPHALYLMDITYDKARSAANNEKHGVLLSHARFIEWGTLWYKLDTPCDYGEARFIDYAYIGPRLFCVVFTDRDSNRHVISLRKATRREEHHYAQA